MKVKKFYTKPTIKTLEIDVSCSLLAGSGNNFDTNSESGEDGSGEDADAKVNFHFLDSDGSW